MIVAGIMSGTSADGINVALVSIAEAKAAKKASAAKKTSRQSADELNLCSPLSIKLLGHTEYPYPRAVRGAILAAMNAESARVADLARLNFLLGELYADAVQAAQRRFKSVASLIGCHGQTIYHQGDARLFHGKKLVATWQTGEVAILAARLGAPVVSDFRPADMAAGGKGAPLVPFFDYLFFRDTHIGRIAQNIGGIANLTAIAAAADANQVIAFDTGPGNMVIDAVTEELFHRPFDRGGKIAASGTVLEPVLRETVRHKFFSERPPKTAGREEFGREFVRGFLHRCIHARKRDIVATATALTARSIADAVERFVLPKPTLGHSFREMILSGGGAKNATLLRMLSKRLAPLGIQVYSSDEFGLPSAAKEAVAFAVLAYETWHRRPSNLPSATGARRPAVLGKISYA